jgi:8-oxo-dGTP diphosphatase
VCWIGDTFLCLKRNPEKKEGGKWGFPAGKVDVGEAPESALRRELHEELCLEVPEVVLKRNFFVRYPSMDFLFSVFETNLAEEPTLEINRGENSMYAWLTLGDFIKRSTVKGNDEIVQILYGDKV